MASCPQQITPKTIKNFGPQNQMIELRYLKQYGMASCPQKVILKTIKVCGSIKTITAQLKILLRFY